MGTSVCLHVYLYVCQVPPWRPDNPLGLELQMFGSHHVVAGTLTQVLGKSGPCCHRASLQSSVYL